MKSLLNNLKSWHDNKEYSKLSIFVLIVLIILELTVFNVKFYKNMFNEPYVVNEPKLMGAIENYYGNEYELGQGEKYFELLDINRKVKNICVDVEVRGDKEAREDQKIKVVVSATDEGNSQYIDLPERAVVYNLKSSKYIPLNLNGITSKLKVNFKDCNNKTIVLNNLVVNAKVPFEFNVGRIAALFVIIVLCYIIRPKNGFYKYKFNVNSKRQTILTVAIAVINIAIVMGLGFAHPNKTINTSSHHHQYHLLAEAMMDGHFYLNDEPAESLKNMENPYDRRLRDTTVQMAGERYKWDTAYYDGKYYVYFGIVPELLFFLPTRLLGIMVVNKAPVIIMTMLAMIFGFMLMRELTRRWFGDTSYLVYMLLSVLFVNSMGVYLEMRIPDLYMIPISHALAFSLMGLYCWILALPEGEKKSLNGVYLFLGSLCLALVAGCRPQVVIASFFALPLFWNATFKDRELFSKDTALKTFGFVIPYVVVAAFLMYYNYARFGNVFDFGASYNLTVMDMVSERFNISKIPLAIYSYFLQPPYLIGIFPYIKNVAIERTFMGNYVMEALFGGMIPCNIILLSMLFIGRVKEQLKEKKLFIIVIMMSAFGLLIAIVDSNTGGLILRYMIDFMWLIFLAAIIVIYALVEKYRDCPISKVMYRFIAVGFVWSMVYNFMLAFNTNAAGYKDSIPALHYYIQHLIEFWA